MINIKMKLILLLRASRHNFALGYRNTDLGVLEKLRPTKLELQVRGPLDVSDLSVPD